MSLSLSHCPPFKNLKSSNKNFKKHTQFLKSLKLVNFCAAILILKTEENTHFQHIMLYYFKKGKTQLKHKKDVCSVWRRCCD